MTASGREAQIAEALFTRVASMDVLSPALPIVYGEEPTTYEPPADGRYVVAQLFWNRPAWAGLSDGRMDQGLLQITLVWPKGQGEIAPLEAVGDIVAHFPQGQTMFAGSTKVEVPLPPWTASPIHEPHQVRFPVTIPWTA